MMYIPIAILLAVAIITIVEYPTVTTLASSKSVATNRTVDDGPIRMITLEELAEHDGNQTEAIWLSILSKVYDVTKGKEYYGAGAPYAIFVGRDANVPFITGAFTPEEGDKSITELTAQQMYSLISWLDFYENEDKYPFVGHLIGELYDGDNQPTAVMETVHTLADEGKAMNEASKKKTRDIIAKRKRSDAEKKRKKEAAAAARSKVVKPKAMQRTEQPNDPVDDVKQQAKVVDGVMRLQPLTEEL